MQAVRNKLFRRKENVTTDMDLPKILSTWDIICLGVSSTLGAGIYILPGRMSLMAGPGVIFSYALCAFVCIFIGLCFAEMSARIPIPGSVYTYSYVCMGEFVAFLAGWSMLLDYCLASTILSRSFTMNLDKLFNGTLSRTFSSIAPLHVEYLSEHFDFVAFFLPILLSICLSMGLKESSILCKIGTFINVLILSVITLAGVYMGRIENWRIPANETNPQISNGGFMPFGIKSLIPAATFAFTGFMGFDTIAMTYGEARTPQKSIPRAIVVTLLTVLAAFIGITCSLTLMAPYYEQDIKTPLPHAFKAAWMEDLVSASSALALFTGLYGFILAAPRILAAMASDGLFFAFFAKINVKFHSPLNASISCGVLVGLMAATLEIKNIQLMMSLSALSFYFILAVCVLIMRYRPENPEQILLTGEKQEATPLLKKSFEDRSLIGKVFNTFHDKTPTSFSQKLICFETAAFGIVSVVLVVSLKKFGENIFCTAISISAAVFLLLIYICLQFQPRNYDDLKPKVPLVPLVPVAIILFCHYMMAYIDGLSWSLYAVWMLTGLFFYGCIANYADHGFK